MQSLVHACPPPTLQVLTPNPQQHTATIVQGLSPPGGTASCRTSGHSLLPLPIALPWLPVPSSPTCVSCCAPGGVALLTPPESLGLDLLALLITSLPQWQPGPPGGRGGAAAEGWRPCRDEPCLLDQPEPLALAECLTLFRLVLVCPGLAPGPRKPPEASDHASHFHGEK